MHQLIVARSLHPLSIEKGAVRRVKVHEVRDNVWGRKENQSKERRQNSVKIQLLMIHYSLRGFILIVITNTDRIPYLLPASESESARVASSR